MAVAVGVALLFGAGATAWLFSARDSARDVASTSSVPIPQPPQIPTMSSALTPPVVPSPPPFVVSPTPTVMPVQPAAPSPAVVMNPSVAQPGAPSRRSPVGPSPTASQPAPRVATNPVANVPPRTPPVARSPAPSGSRSLPPVTGRTAAIASLCDTADGLEASGHHEAAQQARANAWGYLRSAESSVQMMQTSDPAAAEMLRAAAAEERAYLTARLGHP
jgi:hypothetical protein